MRKHVVKQVSFKVETESRNNLEYLSDVDLWRHTFHYLFILPKCTGSSDTLACVVNCVFFFTIFSLLYQYTFIVHDMQRNTQVNLYM